MKHLSVIGLEEVLVPKVALELTTEDHEQLERHACVLIAKQESVCLILELFDTGRANVFAFAHLRDWSFHSLGLHWGLCHDRGSLRRWGSFPFFPFIHLVVVLNMIST